MRFRYSINPIYRGLYLILSILGLCSLISIIIIEYKTGFSLKDFFIVIGDICSSALLFSLYAYQKIELKAGYLLIGYGILYRKKIAYENITSIKYITKYDDMIRADFALRGKLSDTICISVNTDGRIFIPVKEVSKFYLALLRKVKEKTGKII